MIQDIARILLTTDTIGGVWTYSVDLARALNQRGVEVVLATMGQPMSDAQRRDVAALTSTVVCPSTFRLEWMNDAWDDVDACGEWLLNLADGHDVDLVHLGGMSHGSLPWTVPAIVVAHSCVFSWWRAVYGGEPSPAFGTYRSRVRRGLVGANRVVAPSRAMAHAIGQHYGPLPPVDVIWNGRCQDAFQPRGRRPFMLGAGRVWDPAKNMTLLDEAAADVCWPVYIAGPTSCPGGTNQVVRHARWLGVLDESQLGRWMSRASIYVLPARYEPSGLSILEAACAGCALVLGDIPSLRELWSDAAEFVDPEDVDHLKAVLNRLIEDDRGRVALAAKARDRALSRTPAVMADAYLACYREAQVVRTASNLFNAREEIDPWMSSYLDCR